MGSTHMTDDKGGNVMWKQIKELWQMCGPVLVVLGVASVAFIEEGVRYLFFSETSRLAVAGSLGNPVPFFLLGYGIVVLGVVLMAIALAYFVRTKELEANKDIRVVEALTSLAATHSMLLSATPDDQKAGVISTIQQNLGAIVDRLEQIVRKAYDR